MRPVPPPLRPAQALQPFRDGDRVGGFLVEIVPHVMQEKFPEQPIRTDPRPMDFHFQLRGGVGGGWGRRGAGYGRGDLLGPRGGAGQDTIHGFVMPLPPAGRRGDAFLLELVGNLPQTPAFGLQLPDARGARLGRAELVCYSWGPLL